jgi:cyclopropane-fatty-acyl-phospholipid synthase
VSAQHERLNYQNVGASKSAIEHHYDVGNDFYERLLGPTMSYSAGRWLDPMSSDTLDAAQDRKNDWHIDQSGADAAERVLEIGCGWGGYMRRLAGRNPRAEITGLTMSEAQAAYVRGLGYGNFRIVVSPWQNFRSDRPFHSITTIEAIEHFASFGLSREQHIRTYRDFFDFCARHLVRGGRMTLQATTWHNVLPGEEGRFEFIKEFFPESVVPHVPEVLAAADGIFHIIQLENRPRDHVYTMREWLRRLERNETALAQEFGAELVRRYIDNFNLVVGGYATGSISVVRMSLKRHGPLSPWTHR